LICRPKIWITSGLIVGSLLGGFIPALWGDSGFSVTSAIFNFIGGAVGLYVGYKISQAF